MGSYTAGLMAGIAFIAFGCGYVGGARGRTLFGRAWIDGAVLAFIGANVVLLTYFGLRP